jgi:hypothetical protein
VNGKTLPRSAYFFSVYTTLLSVFRSLERLKLPLPQFNTTLEVQNLASNGRVIRGRNLEESCHDLSQSLTRQSSGEAEENSEKLDSE